MGSDREQDLARTATVAASAAGGTAADAAKPLEASSGREQELARTATAASSAAAPATDQAKPLGLALGRYRLERELGAGAMGVVHAAFDPDLERRVALKVLRSQSATLEARDRLLREARAMARLAHPNVVTVHEVGTASGRDFVAMELIDGETLAEWLRASKRPAAAIFDAFLAAGRGLAAAHAAGIVHRDFKPHNVLRSRDGRIVVTDFGLAREAEGPPPPASGATLPVGSESSAPSAPSALAGLTVTGSLLGTPAYMAPEQWRGGAVTPATDQFAYCVALWEAFAGERPYRGPTFDDLRGQVARGPAALDASRIPRRVLGLLRRGLDPDPARRWPSMDALLARLARARRGPSATLAIAGGALVAAAALVFALRPGEAPAPACEPPARDPAPVWSPAIAADLGAKTSGAHVAVLDDAFREWQAARGQACSAPPPVRPLQLACLDGVLARFDALRQAFARVPAAAAEELQAQMIDPQICRKPAAPDVPRLALAPKPDVIAAYELYARSATDAKPTDRQLTALTDASTADPCARVIATLAFDAASKDVLRARSLMSGAVSLADQCGDERLRAELLLQRIQYQRERPMIGPKGEEAIRLAQVAASRVMQPDLEAAVASQRRIAAQQRGQWDEAFRLVETELAGYGARHLPVRQLQAVLARNQLRISRRDPSDLAAVAADARRWRPIAAANHKTKLAWQLDAQHAIAGFFHDDAAAVHAELMRVWQARPPSDRPTSAHAIEGEVVDDRGRPVAGATVAAAKNLAADSVGIGVPLLNGDDSLRITKTDAAGHFVLHDAAAAGAIAAELADRRSRPAVIADHVKLVLEPSRRVSGRVQLEGTPYTHVFVVYEPVDVTAARSYTFAPVGPDGAFSFSGATLGAIRIGVVTRGRGNEVERVEFHSVPASRGAVVDLELTIARSARTIDVIIRSAVATTIDGAEVFLLSGKQQIENVGEILRSRAMSMQHYFARPVVGDSVPGTVAGTIGSGDLLAHVEGAGRGDLTVCACGLPGDLLNPTLQQRMDTHLSQLAVKCKPIGPDASVVVLDVPPQPRFDGTPP